MVISFLAFLAIFVAIGVSSVIKSRGTKQDYYLASSGIPPILVGLSAVATNSSGYMFIGAIGYTYMTGLSSAWVMIGWLIGDYIASTFIHSRLREATEKTGEVSFSGVISQWQGKNYFKLQKIIALISLTFLLAYAGAQLVAGSKALQVLLDWPSSAGAFIGAVLVVLYCMAGGIRASIWTDAAQSCIMIIAMILLMVTAFAGKGGVTASFHEMQSIEGFLDFAPKDAVLPGFLGGFVFALSWAFAGFGVIGQPHIMVRFMTLKEGKQMRQARFWYYLWFTCFWCMATAVAMLARIYITDVANFDEELALPTMAQMLLPDVLTGVVLAGIFAATMSTADSLVLSCSASITHDLFPKQMQHPLIMKGVTVIITVVALAWALMGTQSVFDLVLLAWSGLASAIAPLLVVLCLGYRPKENECIAALFTGLVVALIWRHFGLQTMVYEGMAGILSGLSVFFVGWLVSRRKV